MHAIFSLLYVYSRRSFIFVALSAPSSNYKWPRFRRYFLSCRFPDEEAQKSKTVMFACRGVIRAPGPLLASCGAAALIAGSLASPEPSPSTRCPQAAALEARLHPATGLPLRTPLSHQHAALWVENPGCSPSSLWASSQPLFKKRLNACSLIIWILVNWINCWIETVLLEMTKTQGQGEKCEGLI